MLDLSQLFPTFLTLLRISDPRSWLAGIASSALVNALRMSFLPTSHVKGLSVAAARQSTIALGPDHHSHSDHQILVGDDKSDLLNTRATNPPHLGNDECSTQPPIPPEADPTMTQLYTDNDDLSGKSLNPAHAWLWTRVATST
jgi:hypothetical protein